jgi:hypothetical protein
MVAQNTSGRSSAIDGRDPARRLWPIRKRIRDRVAWAFNFAAAAYNLVRLPNLI